MAIPKRQNEREPHLKVVEKDAPPALHFESEDEFHLPHKKSEEGEGPWLVSYADLMTLLMGFFALIASFSKPDAKEFEKVQKAASEYFGGEYQEPYKKLEEKLNKVIKDNGLKDQVQIKSGVEGLTMTFTGTFFFDSGDFHVKPAAQELMQKMVVAISKDTKGLNATIEGHTDNRPITHPIIASNWELSGLRASRIALLFEKFGFSKSQINILGLGETRPLFPNDNPDGTINPVNQAKNRRVVIRLFKDIPK